MDLVKFDAPSNPSIYQWAAEINLACEGTNVPPCLLAAIVERETGGRNILQEGMPPGAGCGVGLCQITYGVDWSQISQPRYEELNLLNPASNLHVAAHSFLAPLIVQAQAAQKSSPESFAIACRGQMVFAVACGYNAGWGEVAAAIVGRYDADDQTTDGYGEHVLATYEAFVAESHRTA